VSADAQTAREDLAFLRVLLGNDETRRMRSFGEAYFATGVFYGVQLLPC
jgi:hypothetical protein